MCEQEDWESRKVWREVTMGLRINDMDKATAAKCSIEQKQRDEARIRKENNIAWQTKVSKARLEINIYLYSNNNVILSSISIFCVQLIYIQIKIKNKLIYCL